MERTADLPLDCPACEGPTVFQLRQILDLGEAPELRGVLVRDELFDHSCGHCGVVIQVPLPVVVHDPENRQLLVYVPSGTEATEGALARLRSLAASFLASVPEPWPAYLSAAVPCHSWRELAAHLVAGHLEDPAALGIRMSPAMAAVVGRLAVPLRARLLETLNTLRDSSDLQRALAQDRELYDAVLAASPGGGSLYPEELRTILSQLNDPRRRWTREERIALAERALPWTQRSAELANVRAALVQNLGRDYAQLHGPERAVEMERAIEYFEQAVLLFPRDRAPADWAECQHDLGNAYWDRLEGDRRDNLRLSRRHYRRALEQVTPERSPRLWCLANYGLGQVHSLRLLGQSEGEIDLAIHHFGEALRFLTAEDSPDLWARAHLLRGLAPLKRATLRGEELEQGIEDLERALEIYSREGSPEDWRQAHEGLANAFKKRVAGKHEKNTERAIEHRLLALEETGPGEHTALLGAHGDLCGLLQNLYHGDRTAHLERAVQHGEAALAVADPIEQPAARAAICFNLATGFRTRVDGERGENLGRALEHARDGLAVVPDGSELAPVLHHAIALALLDQRREGVDNEGDLELALEHLDQALAASPRDQDPVRWALRQIAVAQVFLDWRPANREVAGKAIAHLEEALSAVQGKDAPELAANVHLHLGLARWRCFELGDQEALTTAGKHFSESLKYNSPGHSRRNRLAAMRGLAGVHFQRRNWRLAADVYGDFLDLRRNFLDAAFTTSARAWSLEWMGQAAGRAAYAHLQLGEPERALAACERGKALDLAERLAAGVSALQELPAREGQTIRRQRQRVDELEAEEQSRREGLEGRALTLVHDELQVARQALEATLERAWARVPNAHHESLDLPLVTSRLGANEVAILPVMTSLGGAVIVLHGEASLSVDDALWLPDFGRPELDRLLYGEGGRAGWLQAWGSSSSPGRGGSVDGPRLLERACDLLGEGLAPPLLERLRSLGTERLLVLPHGGLQALPLHAARLSAEGEGRHLLDELEIRQAPSLQAWLATENALAGQQGEPRLLAVADPQGDLPYALDEVEGVVGGGIDPAAVVLRGAEATCEAVIRGLGPSTHFHFAGHGVFDREDPLSSGLACADGLLTLRQIRRHPGCANLRLASLPACDSARAEVGRAAAELVGLPAAFLAAGTAGVVAALWPVDDLASRFLMTHFHRALAEGRSPAASLRGAQLWLRGASAEELGLAALNRRLFEESGRKDSAAGRRALIYERQPEELPFRHPVYWAPLVFVGA